MNRNLLRTWSVLMGAVLISVAAGCASIQQAFAPSMVAQAKSEARSGGNSPELVPGSVDLRSSAGAALISGSADSAIKAWESRPGMGGDMVPGSADLSVKAWESRPVDRSAFGGDLVPGSLDLRIASMASVGRFGTPVDGQLVPGSVDLFVAQ